MPKYRQTYTLFKRGKFYYYRTYSPDGVRTTARTTGKTSLTAARLYCDELFKNGTLFAGSGKTFEEYAKDFFAKESVYVKDSKLSKASISAYNTAINRNFIPLMGQKKLTDITRSFLMALRQKLLDEGLAPASVKQRMRILGIVIKTAYIDGLISKNPFDSLKEIKYEKKTRDAFSLDEIKSLYEESPEEMKRFVLLFALTGMRLAELAAVSRQELQEKNGVHYIHLEKQYKKEFLPLKAKKPRDIPISKALALLIDEYPFELTNAMYRYVVPLIQKIPRWKERMLCVHSLRHFFISSAKSYGINHLKVEAIAGHSLKGIQEVYTNFNVSDLADIIKWQEWAYGQITGEKLN